MADLDLGLDDEGIREEDNLAALKRTWRNEKCAPVLLPYQEDLVERVRGHIADQQEFLDEFEKDERKDGTTAFMLTLLQLDLERHNFLIRSYLRTRLHKIQKLHQSLLEDEAQYQLMSKHEQKFCKGYTDMLEKHFTACMLARIPESLRDLTKEDMTPKAPVDNHVFVRVIQDIGQEVMIESESLPMEKDETYVVRYKEISQLVAEQKLELV